MPKMDAPPPSGLDTAIAVRCVGLDAGQARLLDLLSELGPERLARVPAGLHNSLAALALHVAATEVRMAYRLTGRQPGDIPAPLRAAYLMDGPQSPLPQPQGETAATLRAKAEQARGLLREALASLREADLEREVVMGPERTATVRWMLTLLPSHQLQHFGQMQIIRQLV